MQRWGQGAVEVKAEAGAGQGQRKREKCLFTEVIMELAIKKQVNGINFLVLVMRILLVKVMIGL